VFNEIDDLPCRRCSGYRELSRENSFGKKVVGHELGFSSVAPEISSGRWVAKNNAF
jgi:hypothetical protein